MISDNALGRHESETDASFVLRLFTYTCIKKDNVRIDRLRELVNSSKDIDSPEGNILVFPDGSKIRAILKEELDEETDEMGEVLTFEVVGSEEE